MGIRSGATIWLIAVASLGCAQESSGPPLVLETMGVMFVGGGITEAPYPCANPESDICTQPGTVRLRHATVHYMLPAEQTHSLPIVMVPGLGLPGAIYFGTPDGREGWAQFFAK